MSFTSYTYILFLGIVFLLYYKIPSKHQWKLLLVSSYVFYGVASPIYIVFLLMTTIITYGGARYIDDSIKRETSFLRENTLGKDERKAYKKRNQIYRKGIISFLVILLILALAIFKYTNFIMQNVFSVMSLFGNSRSWEVLDLVIPVGMSFYIFQSMGYCIDVYREMYPAEKNFFKYALYVSYFPQIMQGPIGEYSILSPMLYEGHIFDYTIARRGIQRIVWGIFKKVVIANQIGILIDGVFSDYINYEGLIWFIVLMLYAVQIYADFSGYMDIVNGSSQMLGITLGENFETPYFSSSVAEFWRRWHITLGTWFKNYLFYPLLRSKSLTNMRKRLKKKGRNVLSNMLPTVCTLAVVWLCTGIWHGASWNYILYGIYYGIYIILDVIMQPLYSKWWERHKTIENSSIIKVFRIVRTFFIVVIGYAIFRPINLVISKHIVLSLFKGINSSIIIDFVMSNLYVFIIVMIGTLILFVVDLYHLDGQREYIRDRISHAHPLVKYSVYMLALFVIALFGVFGQSSFIYFNF